MSESEHPAVELAGITKRFGDVVANEAADLTVERGSVHALVGENGAGKTTLMNVLYGLYEPDEGTIRVDGERRAFDSPRDAMEAGIGMIHQHFMLVDPMTVTQNVVLGSEPTSYGLVDVEQARAEIRDLCDAYGFDIADSLSEPVEALSVGAQQRVEIVKSLYRGADTLVLDEPTAVLTPQEIEQLVDVLDELTNQGHSIIFITHKLDEAMTAADRVTVLRDGHVTGTVAADETSREELARMMVGRDVLFDLDDDRSEPGDGVLFVDGLTIEDDRGLTRVDDVDLTVREGEIFGIAGVEGNGQSELLEAVTGLRSAADGSVWLEELDLTDESRRRHIEAGISVIPEDRQSQGVVMEFDLVENALLGNQTLEPYADGGLLDWEAVEAHARQIVADYDVDTPDVDAEAASLSGGNQQKFIVGREFERDPKLVVAAHPTRGVDVGSIEYIHDRLLELRDEGAAVLLVSSKLDEVRKLSSRLAVMTGGAFADVVDPEAVSEAELGLLMAGRNEANSPAADGPSPSATDGGDRR